MFSAVLDGDVDTVTRPAVIVGEGRPGPGDPVLVQVSCRDRLKDMAGSCAASPTMPCPGDGYLMLAGPAVTDVSDDPEGAAVYGECLLQRHELSPAARARILLTTLPLDDIDQNAAMVNALRRHATVIAQKSLAEGFGLTVSEAMWKGRPVIGPVVGGIIDQVGEGTGILLRSRRPDGVRIGGPPPARRPGPGGADGEGSTWIAGLRCAANRPDRAQHMTERTPAALERAG